MMGVTEIERAIPHAVFIPTDVPPSGESSTDMNSSLFTKATAGLLGTIGVAGAGLGLVKLPTQAPVTAPPAAVSAPAAPASAPAAPQAPIVIQAPAAPAPAPAPEPLIEHSAPIIVNSPAPAPSGDVSSTNGPAINVNVASTNNNVQEQANHQQQDQKDTQTQTAPVPAAPTVPAKPSGPVQVVPAPKAGSGGFGKISAKIGAVLQPAPSKSSPTAVGQVNKTINQVLPCDPFRKVAGLC